MQCDEIEVPLAKQHRLLPTNVDPPLVQTIEHVALVIERVLRTVEVLGGRLPLSLHRRSGVERASAEGYDLSVH
ncbi:MAG: hypothetical protein AAF997_22405, partial [Myxococcota bacterium]